MKNIVILLSAMLFMVACEKGNEEMKEAEEKGYKFIPPYKLNEMMKLSGKIVKILTDYNIPVTLCYDDMKIVLKMANCALEQGIQQKER